MRLGEINRHISKKNLLEVLGLDQDTYVFCGRPSELEIDNFKLLHKKFKVGDMIVFRYVCRCVINYSKKYYYFKVKKVFQKNKDNMLLALSNINGPSSITIYENNIIDIIYYINGKVHRSFLPAYIKYKDGIIIYEAYYINNKIHNSIGPASRHFKLHTSNTWDNEFCVNDNWLSKDAFCDLLSGRFL